MTLEIDDIRKLYTQDEADQIADTWDDLIDQMTRGGRDEWVWDAVGDDDLWAFAQLCRDYAREDLSANRPRQMELGE